MLGSVELDEYGALWKWFLLIHLLFTRLSMGCCISRSSYLENGVERMKR